MNKRKTFLELGTNVIRIKPIGIGVLSGLTLCGTLLFILAFAFVKSSSISESLMEPIMLISSGIGTFMGGYFSSRLSKEKGLIYGLLCAFLMFVFVFIAGLASVRTPLSLLTLIRLFIMLFCGGLGGIIGVNKKHR